MLFRSTRSRALISTFAALLWIGCRESTANRDPALDSRVRTPRTDVTAPTAPRLRPAVAETSGIALQWKASTDNVAVTGYRVWRADANYNNWILVQPVPASTLQYTDGSVTAGSTYTYGIRAVDGAGNISNSSNIRAAAATAGGGGGTGGGMSTTDAPPLFDATDGSANYLRSAIPANPVIDPNSAAIISAANLTMNVPRASGPQWLAPIYRTNNGDPAYNPPLQYATDWGCSVGGSIHIPNMATREVPQAAAGDWDGWIAVVNTDDHTVKAIWRADKSAGSWKGACAGSYSLHGNGFTRLTGVGTGSGAQMGAGIILFSELAQGRIDHAIYMTSTVSCRTFRAPATKSDGQSTASTCVPMGARVQLDPTVNCDALTGATAGEAMICHAIQTYGGYILDSGGAGPISGVPIQGDDLTDPNRSPWQTPGNSERGTRACAPVSATCGQAAHVGITGTPSDLAHIPWTRLRILARWDGT